MAARHRRHRGRDERGHTDPFFLRRKRFEAVLAPMGLWEKFVAMPRMYCELFYTLKLPDPIVLFDDAANAAAKRSPKGMRAAADRYLRNATVKLVEGGEIAVRDFIGVVTGIMTFCQVVNLGAIPATKTAPAEFKAFIDAATPVLEACHTANLAQVWERMYSSLINALLYGCRQDRQLFTALLEAPLNERGRHETRIRVTATQAIEKLVEIDGAPRPMWRVGQHTQNTLDVNWISWDAGHLPGGLAGRKVPVYVQAHALRRLHERVTLPYADTWLEPWMATSLADPVIVERSGDDWLVEYRIRNYRLGYLIVTSAQEHDTRERCVAVRTFKLLTMSGTPEARMLERRLRLSRKDVDWLRLHKLESFTHTDLRNDSVLRGLLEKCGCGHLFEMAEKQDFAPEQNTLAAEMRKYLRIAA